MILRQKRRCLLKKTVVLHSAVPDNIPIYYISNIYNMSSSPEPINKKLYAKVKKMADEKYETHGAYKSAWIVKKYKELGGKYKGKKDPKKGISRWLSERWTDYAGLDYPVYRPTKRITKQTPLTLNEIDPQDLFIKAIQKQYIKGKKNLPPFVKDIL
jgi:hypothetical protein